MKKTVFKGVINGKEFNSVEDYNNEMLRALAAGETIKAESHTETVDQEECNCSCQSKYQKEAEDRYCMLPRFHDTEYYIDALVTGEDDKDSEVYAKELEQLSDTFEFIKEQVSKFSDASFDEYYDDVDDVCAMISDDDEDNEATIANLNEEREELVKRIKDIDQELRICENAKPVITLYQDFYGDVKELLNEIKGNKELEYCKCPTCGCTKDLCECDKDLCANAKDIDLGDLENTVKKLLKNIFG